MTDIANNMAPGAAGPSAGWLKRFMRSEAGRGLAMISPTFGFALAMLALPLLATILLSFWTQNFNEFDTTLTMNNYIEAWSEEIYQLLMLRSLIVSGIVTIVTVALAYPLAYYVAFHVDPKRQSLWLFLITIPFWTSYLLRIFAWKVILGYNGVLNSGLIWLGLIDEPLTFVLYNPTAVVLTLAHAWAAFAILPIYVSLRKIDHSLLEAATDLGDGPIRRFLRVTLPLSAPGIIGACLIIFIPTIGDYVTPALVGGPDGIMISNVIQAQFGKVDNKPLGAALAVSAMLIVASISLTFVVASRFAAKQAR